MSSPPGQAQEGTSCPTTRRSLEEPLPSVSDPPTPTSSFPSSTENSPRIGETSNLQQKLRRASTAFEESSPPTGMWMATAQVASTVPTISDIRRGSFGSEGLSGEGQIREKERRASQPRRASSGLDEDLQHQSSAKERQDSLVESPEEGNNQQARGASTDDYPLGSDRGLESVEQSDIGSPDGKTKRYVATSDGYRTTPFDNGYQFPPKHKWTKSMSIFLKAAGKFVLTPLGFLITIYGLNVVAWGGMLFLLLSNAAPAMCTPTCNDINSPRRVWVEIDSQILNALFCVTGFGLIPWRFRDLYYLLQYRIRKKELGLRRLAGINRGWLRLKSSEEIPVTVGPADIEDEVIRFPERCVPFPLAKIPDAPLTGKRAPATALWKLDFVVWSMVINTFLQAVLSGFMWGLNRYDRPSWSTGLFVALACIVAGAGGIMTFLEGKKVKSIEGVPVSDEDKEQLRRDRELGITHYNNIKGEKPKEEKGKKQKESREGSQAEKTINGKE